MRGYSTVISLVLCSLCHLITTQPWNCKAEIGAYSWDLTALNKEKTISRTRSSPPSTFEDEVRFNLCDVIKKREGYDSLDQVRHHCSSASSMTLRSQLRPSGSRLQR
ncbi:hypothetical protein FRB94_005845 [Tulasnella sp. JGI-2019a]|nr:hypothetical protein FRB94_005845 [Tulasnella sp. JGI-2019a]